MSEIVISKVNLNMLNRKRINDFLNSFGLILDSDVEYTAAALLDDMIVGTCSYSKRVLKCFAVVPELQGEGIAAKLITHISNVMFEKGIYDTFIFTKPENLEIFKGLSYKEVYSVSNTVLLEGGTANVSKYTQRMFVKSGLSMEPKAALVMNCNPFTLGHRYLIERAAQENEQVVVFIVEEDRSLFPFETRLELVKKGTEDLKNVKVIPGGMYIISSSTFPSYFLRQKDERLKAYTQLDAGIFGKYIAPAFNINRRYVGTEPYCGVTSVYNDSLISILPEYNIDVRLIERIGKDNAAISASKVRSLIKEGKADELYGLLPSVTLDFLKTQRGLEIIENIKRSDSPH